MLSRLMALYVQSLEFLHSCTVHEGQEKEMNILVEECQDCHHVRTLMFPAHLSYRTKSSKTLKMLGADTFRK